jgi:hypothetical protein
MYNTIFRQIAFVILFLTPSIAPLPAHAMTAEEFLKFLGVLGRYSDDINRTFRPNSQPNIPSQTDPDPNSQPNLPQFDRSQPNQQTPNPTTDRSMEQFYPRQ